ncbi:MAG: methyltransferase domain-containing protein [Hyphomicrobiales bacterium]
MASVVRFDTCPSCGHDTTFDLLPQEMEFDNDLEWLYTSGQIGEIPPETDVTKFHRKIWAVCDRCTLIFARKRPALMDAEKFYEGLFIILERRRFLTNPLPDLFVNNHRAFASKVVDELERHDVLSGVGSVFQARCYSAEILREIRDRHGIQEVYGLDFFDELRRHAREVNGLEHISSMRLPEFTNPFERKKFDLVIIAHMFTHAHDLHLLAATAKDLMAENGRLLSYNEPDHELSFGDERMYRRGVNYFHKQLFTRRSLETFFRIVGIELETLTHPPTGKWTGRSNGMLLVGRPAEPLDPETLSTGNAQPVIDKFTAWWDSHLKFSRRLNRKKKLADMFGLGKILGPKSLQ